MRFILITMAAIAGLALGQTQGGINLPPCATACVSEFVAGSKLGTCELIDIKCICENKAFLADIACCLTRRCEAADQANAAREALNFCNIAAATGLPTAVTCATASQTSSTPSSTASQTSSAPSSTASVSTSGCTHAAIHNMGGVGAGVLGAFAAALL